MTLIGRVEEIDTDTDRLKEVFLKKLPNAFYVDFGDFHWFKMMEVIKAQYTVGLASNARTGTVTDRARFGSKTCGFQAASDVYLSAIPDPMAPFSARACKHMNEDHQQDIMALVEAATGFEVESAKFKRIDRLGGDIYCSKLGLAPFTCRVAFSR